MPKRDLVVLSHLRWTWVWQRPQHLVSRLAATFDRTWFVEEPLPCGAEDSTIRAQDRDGVTRLWIDAPGSEEYIVFDDERAAPYATQLRGLVGDAEERVVWVYSPAAFWLVPLLEPSVVVYDMMDDLASFKDASPRLRDQQRQLLAAADVVFTGGRSLHSRAQSVRRDGVHLFPSGVDVAHYAPAVAARCDHERPVLGYVGVLDERLDMDLIAGVAAALPDWDIRMVGPHTKIPASSLVQAPNLRYLGPRTYADLPAIMAGLDVAMMPFADNEATRSISPTKTLEYLAAGLPVVSTPVPDVVTDYGHIVDIAEDASTFARRCREALTRRHDVVADPAVATALQRHSWDSIAAGMHDLLIPPRVITLTEEQSA
jgi:glycosyltransferase involved in cell wall biosynthesis